MAGKIKKGFTMIPVKRLIPAEWNYKLDDEELAEKLKNNIEMHGQLENIMVRQLDSGGYEIVNGNHRLPAFRDLKIKEVMCFNFGKISDAQAKRIAVETNETRFPTDYIRLAELIKGISDETPMEELERTMPWTMEELEDFRKFIDLEWPVDQKNETTETVELEEGEIICPHCGEVVNIDDEMNE